MKFSKDQLVKIVVGLNEWREATVVEDSVNQAWCKIKLSNGFGRGQEMTVPAADVRQFQPLEYIDGECPALDENAKKDMPAIVQSLTMALAKLLPDQPFLVEGNTIVAYNCVLTMEPVVAERKTIIAFIEQPGWSVTVHRFHPATRGEPESESTVVVGKYPHYGQAVQKFIETLFLLNSEDYWDNQADMALIKQWEQTHEDF